MFGMSVNEVPGWLVTMAPSAIGVPVAATPGLVPHCDVLTVDVLAELVAADAGVLEVPVELVLLLGCCCSRRRLWRWPRRARSFFAPTYMLSSLPLFWW